MNQVEATVLQLVQAALFNKNMEFSKTIDWKSVFYEMKWQTISAIPADVIGNSIDLPTKVKEAWGKEGMVHLITWSRILYAQNELVEILEKEDIPIVILKGVAAAYGYPKPEYRSMGDVDFLVPKEKFDRAYKVLIDAGYALKHDEEHAHHHITLTKNNVVFEIHKAPAGMPQGEEGQYIESLLEEGLRKREFISVERYQVPIFPPLQNSLVLLLHIRSHLERGLGLRQILDWMMFVHKNLNDEVYAKEYKRCYQKSGLELLAIGITRMCQCYLGLSEEINWCKNYSNQFCEELLLYILEQGNFGYKGGKKEETARSLTRIRVRKEGIVGLFKRLSRHARDYWDPAEKYPILRPVGILLEIVRNLKQIFSQKKAVKKFLSDVKKSKQRQKMFESLK